MLEVGTNLENWKQNGSRVELQEWRGEVNNKE